MQHKSLPVETWSPKAMGTSVAAYFIYNIRASNFSNLLASRASG